jgi:hypothetical protein
LNTFEVETAVKEFAEIARLYCVWAEAPLGNADVEMLTARKMLAELHRAAIRLPELGAGDTVEVAVPQREWEAACRHFSGLPVNNYWDVFNPLEEETPVLNTLFDDLTDIYHDLKRGLLIYELGELSEAVWEWRFNFEIHWGAHLTGAQRAIHSYCSERAI